MQQKIICVNLQNANDYLIIIYEGCFLVKLFIHFSQPYFLF